VFGAPMVNSVPHMDKKTREISLSFPEKGLGDAARLTHFR